MVDYDNERFPGYNPNKDTSVGDYDEIWNGNGGAMNEDDVPPFAGEDFYNPSQNENPFEAGYDENGNPIDVEGKRIHKDEKNETPDADRYETSRTVERGYGGAENLASYGLDTASRVYGFKNVLKAISETDESDRDVYNPIGSIYSRLAPNPDERRHLYNEIQKDSVVNDIDDDAFDNIPVNKVAISDEGEFFVEPPVEQETTKDQLMQRESNVAVREMKKILEALQNDERFDSLRERAAGEGKDVIDYITSGEGATITSFFDGLDTASNGSAEEILDEIEQGEAVKDVEEVKSMVQAGEEVSDEQKAEALEAAEKLKDTSLDEFNGLNPDMLK